MTVRVFGIRHHGPGSARSLEASLASWSPDVVLIEGPPEAEPVLPLAASPAMRPPVALLGYLPARPGRYSFYPMAGWSPEWVALRHGIRRQVPVRMIDLPVAAFLDEAEPPQPASAPSPPPGEQGVASDSDEPPEDAEGYPPGGPPPRPYDGDPLGRLAEAAGYDDAERWWEDVVEHRGGEEPWDAITEAMAELRAVTPPGAGLDPLTEERREASMRQHIRTAEKAYDRVAVVCGAWHAPALVHKGPARRDADLLKGLRRHKAVVTWVPWTNGRLSFRSGYGAGVASPGWYEHLYQSADGRPVEGWMARVAALLRAEQMEAPPASVIDAVRLAEALGTMRDRPRPGLSECSDAALAVLGGGHERTLELIEARLVVGDVIGDIPPETPAVPLAADLAAHQRRLRLRPETSMRLLDLDLRREIDRERSRLLHRLDLLRIPWGVVMPGSRGAGTFREEWSLGWEPELAVRVIEASRYGTTVAAAATSRAKELAGEAGRLPAVTDLVERCLLAGLDEAVGPVMAALDRRAAATSDVGELMDALAPLARALRYGNVRRTDASALEPVVRGVVARVCVGIVPACASLDDDAARVMTDRIAGVTSALGTLGDAGLRSGWLDAVERLSALPSLHGLPAGHAARQLLDAGRLDAAQLAERLSAALSAGESPTRAAAWVEGLVTGGGLILVHDPTLLGLIDEWLAGVADSLFGDVLPLLRRAFSDFQPAERRLIGQAAGRLTGPGTDPRTAPAGGGGLGPLDETRAALVLPLLRRLLGPPTPIGEQR